MAGEPISYSQKLANILGVDVVEASGNIKPVWKPDNMSVHFTETTPDTTTKFYNPENNQEINGYWKTVKPQK